MKKNTNNNQTGCNIRNNRRRKERCRKKTQPKIKPESKIDVVNKRRTNIEVGSRRGIQQVSGNVSKKRISKCWRAWGHRLQNKTIPSPFRSFHIKTISKHKKFKEPVSQENYPTRLATYRTTMHQHWCRSCHHLSRITPWKRGGPSMLAPRRLRRNQ